MNALCSPVIALLNSMKFPAKFALIAILFLLPLTILSYVLLQDLQQKIDATTQEQLGLEYIVPLRNLAEHTAQHRGMTHAYLLGSTAFKDQIQNKRDQLRDEYKKLLAVDAPLTKRLKTNGEAATFQQRWIALEQAAFSMQPEESFQAHSALIDDILSYIRTISDAANLSTDPVLGTHYLISTLTSHLPNLAEILGQTRGFGAGLSARDQATPQERFYLTGLSNKIEQKNRMITSSMQKVFIELPNIRSALKSEVESANEKTTHFIHITNNELINATDISVASKLYFDIGSQAIAANLQLFDAIIPVVKQQLQLRHDEASKLEVMVFGLALSSLLLLLYVLFALYLSLRDNVSRLVTISHRLSVGDFSVSDSLKSQDEFSHIAAAMEQLRQRMADSILSVLDSSDTLVNQSKELNRLSLDTGSSIKQQVNEVQQAASAIYEMAASSSGVSDNTHQAASSANEAKDSSVSGQKVVGNMIDSIESLVSEINEASIVIQKVSEDSINITGILDVIKGISEQTNLLALNAAIEAARAGEQGRGFAVVADEVRLLAQKTQSSTVEIQSMIEQLQENAKEATTVMSLGSQHAETCLQQATGTSDAFSEIASHVSSIDNMNSQIASTTQGQSDVAEEINRNIVNITQLMDGTAQGSNKTLIASAGVATISAEVQMLLGRFSIDLDETRASRHETKTAFKWRDSLSIGIEEVDRQHKVLINQINDVYLAIIEDRGQEAVSRALKGLVQYTTNHFDFEESLLEQFGYAEAASHKEQHRKLLNQVSGFIDQVESGAENVMEELLKFLINWLQKHINGSDAKYATHLISMGAR